MLLVPECRHKRFRRSTGALLDHLITDLSKPSIQSRSGEVEIFVPKTSIWLALIFLRTLTPMEFMTLPFYPGLSLFFFCPPVLFFLLLLCFTPFLIFLNFALECRPTAAYNL